jgi:hypothetical protein
VGDYWGELYPPLAASIVEPNGLGFEANVQDGFVDTKRRERLRLAQKHAFRIENLDWYASEH